MSSFFLAFKDHVILYVSWEFRMLVSEKLFDAYAAKSAKDGAFCKRDKKKNRKPFGFRRFRVEVTGFEVVIRWKSMENSANNRMILKRVAI